MISRTPTFAEVLNALKAAAVAGVRVAMPGRVERYDAALQVADVKPLLGDAVEQEDGDMVNVSVPVVTNVPVCFPGAGGFRVTFPVQAGDTVELIFNDRSIDSWQARGGEAFPADLRRHHLSDAVAIPGLHPNSEPWRTASADKISIGKDDGAADMAATAQRVLTEINKIKTAFDGHTHPAGLLVAPNGPVTGVTAGAAASPALSAPASETVEVRG